MDTKYRRIYTPSEVSVHNSRRDCWVIIHGVVYELTKLFDKYPGTLAAPLIDAAGEDISHWFDPDTREPKTAVHPVTGLRTPVCPAGRFIHVPPMEPTSSWSLDADKPWWADEQYQVGSLSNKARKIQIVNTLTGDEHILEVGGEETVAEIQDRYLHYNAHAGSYTWKSYIDGKFHPLDVTKTLADNGVPDEDALFEELHMDADEWLPIVHLYMNDDLTVA